MEDNIRKLKCKIDDFEEEKQSDNEKIKELEADLYVANGIISDYIDITKEQDKEIEELKKALGKRVKYCNELEKDLFENCSNYVVSKDKIRAKIEIRKEEKENCKDSIEEKYLLREIYILQSLLEEED